MAIQFARIEIVGRSSGGNACCKGAYNARTTVTDQRTNTTYNFSQRGDNIHHAILLPEWADEKFYDVSAFTNLVERFERRNDSQLLKDIVLALPDDKELNLQDRIAITNRLIDKRAWVNEGLGVQVDIHKPHGDEQNWHAHLLVTTRRFNPDGLSFGLKATDLNPQFRKVGNKAYAVPEEQQIHEELRDIINGYFAELGLANRVDNIGTYPQEHIGPVRMRSPVNGAIIRNAERQIANVQSLEHSHGLLEQVVKNNNVFSKGDLLHAVKYLDAVRRDTLVEATLSSEQVIRLYSAGNEVDNKDADVGSALYTTKTIRAEELTVIRLCDYIAKQKNVIPANSLEINEGDALSYLLTNNSGVRILNGNTGNTGTDIDTRSVLGEVAKITSDLGVNTIGLAPSYKAKQQLAAIGYDNADTIKGFLFKLHNTPAELANESLLVIDAAEKVTNTDYCHLLKIAAAKSCNVILVGDRSLDRHGIFECLADKFGSHELQLDSRCEHKDMRASDAFPKLGASINYPTQEEIAAKELLASKGLFSRIYDRISTGLFEQVVGRTNQDQMDLAHHHYTFKKPEVSQNEAASILKLIPSSSNNINQDHTPHQKLHTEANANARSIGTHLLGEPNAMLSNRSMLRWGDDGNIALQIRGDNSGAWYNFEHSNGSGNIVDLVRNVRDCDYTEAASYVHMHMGTVKTASAEITQWQTVSSRYLQYIQAQRKGNTPAPQQHISIDHLQLQSHTQRPQHVQSHLNAFRQQKEQANSISDIIAVIAQEQHFLSGLQDRLQDRLQDKPDQPTHTTAAPPNSSHGDIHGSSIIAATNTELQEPHKTITDLRNVTNHVLEHGVIPLEELMQQLRSSNNSNGARMIAQDLTTTCRDHYTDIVKKNVDLIYSNIHKDTEINGLKFSCPVEYLKHEVANPPHPYADVERFNKSIPRIQQKLQTIELHKQMELTKSKEHEYSYDMSM